MALLRDFDAAWAERHVEPIRLRLFGREWELPGAMTAERMMQRQRALTAVAAMVEQGKIDDEGKLRLNKGDRLPEGAEEMLRSLMTVDRGEADELIGADTLAEWFQMGLTGPQLAEIVDAVKEEHDRRNARLIGDTTPDPQEEGEGEGNPPARKKAGTGSARSTSSRSGRSSKRTSTGSTASTSSKSSGKSPSGGS